MEVFLHDGIIQFFCFLTIVGLILHWKILSVLRIVKEMIHTARRSRISVLDKFETCCLIFFDRWDFAG